MRFGLTLAAILAMILGTLAVPALAQNQNSGNVPGTQLPVQPPPPPLTNPQPAGTPPRLDTFSDKVGRCAHVGATQGLPPGSLDAYTRSCANN